MSKTEEQKRFTFDDCLHNQYELRQVLADLIYKKRPIIPKEKEGYFKLIPKALLSQGIMEPLTIVIEDGWFTFESLQTFAIRLGMLNKNQIRLSTNRPEKVSIVVPIETLWQKLYDKMLYQFPKASSEALQISAEVIKRPQQLPITFTSKGDD